MKIILTTLGALLVVLCAGAAFAGECINDRWQPTFVRHQAVAPTVYYYTGTTFVPVTDESEAQRLCLSQGVRDPKNGETCAQRTWSDFVCACNIEPAGNKTCVAFQNFVESASNTPPWRELASVRRR